MSAAEGDAENPAIPITGEENKFSFIPRTPVDSMMITSSIANTLISCMWIYTISGNAKLALPLSLVAIPCSMVCTIADSAVDYENWKKTKHMRDKGLPEKFLPHKIKYDWTEFDARIKSESKKPSFTGVSK